MKTEYKPVAVDVTPLTIELPFGYTDKEGKNHRSVTFGRRLPGREFFMIDHDGQGKSSTQYSDMIVRHAITAFGTLRMPVGQHILLGLKRVDREVLAEEHGRFMEDSMKGRSAELLSESTVRLAFGVERDGLVYDTIEFGKHITGNDEVEAHRQKLIGVKRECYLVGKQVIRMSSSENEQAVIEGPMTLSVFDVLDSSDIAPVLEGAARWRDSFRRTGTRDEGQAADGMADSVRDGMEAGVHSQPAG